MERKDTDDIKRMLDELDVQLSKPAHQPDSLAKRCGVSESFEKMLTECAGHGYRINSFSVEPFCTRISIRAFPDVSGPYDNEEQPLLRFVWIPEYGRVYTEEYWEANKHELRRCYHAGCVLAANIRSAGFIMSGDGLSIDWFNEHRDFLSRWFGWEKYEISLKNRYIVAEFACMAYNRTRTGPAS